MLELIARISDNTATFSGSDSLMGKECPPSASEYTLQLPFGINWYNNPELLRLLALGLFFDNDWSMDGTTSYFFIRNPLDRS